MRDSADSVVQTQTASTIIRHKRAVWKSTLRVHHSAHAVFELRVAVTGPFACFCFDCSLCCSRLAHHQCQHQRAGDRNLQAIRRTSHPANPPAVRQQPAGQPALGVAVLPYPKRAPVRARTLSNAKLCRLRFERALLIFSPLFAHHFASCGVQSGGA